MHLGSDRRRRTGRLLQGSLQEQAGSGRSGRMVYPRLRGRPQKERRHIQILRQPAVDGERPSAAALPHNDAG